MTVDYDAGPNGAPGRAIRLTVNGKAETITIEDRELLVEVLRNRLGLTGTHIGCYNGDCGACTVRIGDRIAKSCLSLAASLDGAAITTIEGYSRLGLDDLQQALWDHDAFQCGFCVPGHLFALSDLLAVNAEPDERSIRTALIGNLCRCTGYMNLVAATIDAASRRKSRDATI